MIWILEDGFPKTFKSFFGMTDKDTHGEWFQAIMGLIFMINYYKLTHVDDA